MEGFDCGDVTSSVAPQITVKNGSGGLELLLRWTRHWLDQGSPVVSDWEEELRKLQPVCISKVIPSQDADSMRHRDELDNEYTP